MWVEGPVEVSCGLRGEASAGMDAVGKTREHTIDMSGFPLNQVDLKSPPSKGMEDGKLKLIIAFI